MKPSQKNKEMENILEKMMGRTTCITNNTCTICGREIDPDTEFKDVLSRKEYTISGMCQTCQDKVFAG